MKRKFEVKNIPANTDKKVTVALQDDIEDRIWKDAVTEDFMKGDSEKDAAYDKL